jgi:hypothetical protein
MAMRSLRRSLRFANMLIFLCAVLGCFCPSSRDSSVNFLTPEAKLRAHAGPCRTTAFSGRSGYSVISHTSTPSRANTSTLACFRAPTINSAERRFLHGESPFIGGRFRRKLTLNMHQKIRNRSLLNVTVLFAKETMGE